MTMGGNGWHALPRAPRWRLRSLAVGGALFLALLVFVVGSALEGGKRRSGAMMALLVAHVGDHHRLVAVAEGECAVSGLPGEVDPGVFPVDDV